MLRGEQLYNLKPGNLVVLNNNSGKRRIGEILRVTNTHLAIKINFGEAGGGSYEKKFRRVSTIYKSEGYQIGGGWTSYFIEKVATPEEIAANSKAIAAKIASNQAWKRAKEGRELLGKALTAQLDDHGYVDISFSDANWDKDTKKVYRVSLTGFENAEQVERLIATVNAFYKKEGI